VNFP